MRDITKIKVNLFPMDVICSISYAKDHYFKWPLWEHLPIAAAIGSIKRHQHRRYDQSYVYHRRARAYCNLTHAVMYIDPEHVFNVTIPRSKFSHIDEILANPDPIVILRHRAIGPDPCVSAMGLHPDKTILMNTCKPMIGKSYDIPELFTHLIGELLGYDTLPIKVLAKLLGIGKNNMVCSVGVRTVFEKYRQITGAYPRLYNSLVELTDPALLAIGEADEPSPLVPWYDEVQPKVTSAVVVDKE